jgi:predicted extracellular nuclease
VGDQVRVTGLVTEFFGFTEIDVVDVEILVESSQNPLPEPVAIAPPAENEAQLAYFEPLEAMLVTVEGAAPVVGPTYSGCGFAVQIGPADNSARVFRRRLEDPVGQVVPILHDSDVTCDGFPNVKSRDLVEGILGPLIYHFDQFKIVQQTPEDLRVTPAPLIPLPEPSPLAAGQLSIATFNLENHFDGSDDTGDDAEPKPSAEAIATRQTKLAHALVYTLGCPTVAGVQEVEKKALLDELAAAVAKACGFSYEVTHHESVDSRGIDVALLSDPRGVTVQASGLQQGCTTIDTGIQDAAADCPAGQSPLFSRPPLQVDVEIDGRAHTFFVNHFKSKREGDIPTAPRRLAQARHINELVGALLAQDQAARIVVMGDFNDYDQSPPLLAMTEGDGRLTNVLLRIAEAERYSYVFGGVSQLIDGLLVSPAVVEDVVAVTIQHTSADYPYTWSTDLTPARLPYRATDHDLPLLVLALPEESAEESATATPVMATAFVATAIPVEPASPVADSRSNRLTWMAAGLLGLTTTLAILIIRRRPLKGPS